MASKLYEQVLQERQGRVERYVRGLSTPQAQAYARKYAENVDARSYQHPSPAGISPRAAEIIRAHIDQAIRGG